MTDDYLSAQKDKYINNYRRDYSAESLTKFNFNTESSARGTEQKYSNSISPYKSSMKAPLKAKRVSIEENVPMSPAPPKETQANYYENPNPYRRPQNAPIQPNVQRPVAPQSQQIAQRQRQLQSQKVNLESKENEAILIQDNEPQRKLRYHRNYKKPKTSFK